MKPKQRLINSTIRALNEYNKLYLTNLTLQNPESLTKSQLTHIFLNCSIGISNYVGGAHKIIMTQEQVETPMYACEYDQD